MQRATETHAAVRRITDAAKKIAADPSLVEPLVQSSGLSKQSVELALSQHLETNPTDQEIESLISRAAPTSAVHVILSANVFIGALRAIACARAAAPQVSVQLSSREPVFAQKLIDVIADPTIFTANQEALENLTQGEVHIYGRAETIEKVRARVKSSVRLRAHGPGIGIAVVSKNDAIAHVADALARDVVPFDQRGCLSPRVVFVVGDFARAEEFAEQLDVSLGRLAKKIPRGAVTSEEAAESVRFLETMRFVGSTWSRHDSAVSLSKACVVPPPGRHVHVASIESLDAFADMVKPISNWVTAVGSSDVTIDCFFSHSVRVSEIGNMQRPPFDGPVDLREI